MVLVNVSAQHSLICAGILKFSCTKMITEKSHLKAKQFDVSKRLAAVGYPQTLVRKGDREKAYSNAAVTCQFKS